MKRTPSLRVIFIVILGLLFIPTTLLFATVGGPTYISDIAYKSQDSSLYYTVHDNSGRGCPPIVHRINLTNLKDTEVLSCDQFDQQYSYSEEGMQRYNQFISSIYGDLPYAGSISLKNNSIDIKVEQISEHFEADGLFWTDFRANISQNGKRIASVDFRGCNKEQPHTFEGFMIPNKDMMALLISNKGDCLEGGYIKETLRMITGVQFTDVRIIRGYKQAAATEPNAGNLVVFASAIDSPPSDKDATSTSTKTSAVNIILITATFVLAVTIAYIIGKKSLGNG